MTKEPFHAALHSQVPVKREPVVHPVSITFFKLLAPTSPTIVGSDTTTFVAGSGLHVQNTRGQLRTGHTRRLVQGTTHPAFVMVKVYDTISPSMMATGTTDFVNVSSARSPETVGAKISN